MADPAQNADKDGPIDLTREVQMLRAEVAKLNNHRYIKMHDSLWRLGAFQLFRGLAFGLGSVLGATLLVSLLVQILATVDFIPVLGDWVAQIIEQLKLSD